MTRHSQRSEGSQEAAIFQCKQAEGNDDEQDRLLVHMPAEKERRIATERDGRNEVVPSWPEEEFQ